MAFFSLKRTAIPAPPPPINDTKNNSTSTANYDQSWHAGVQLLRIVPLMVYMRYATLMFAKILLAAHPNLSDRSIRYQNLVKRLILCLALLLSMLIWLIETEFMSFFLKYVIVYNYPPINNPTPVVVSFDPCPFQKLTPQHWFLPPRVLTETFVTLKLIALNSIISKYDAMASGEAEPLSPTVSSLGFFAIELSRMEDILVEFFENCELGRSGYLLVNPIRKHTSSLLKDFQKFIDGRLYKIRDVQTTADDLATLPLAGYRSPNSRRSHSVNCIDDFRKFVTHNDKEYDWTNGGGAGRRLERNEGAGPPARLLLPMRPFELEL